MADEDAAFRTLPLDVRGERQIGWLRLVAAASCLVAAVWLASIGPPARGWWCIGAGVAAALMWVGLWARGRRLLRRADDHALALAADGLTLREGDASRQVAWPEVVSVEADEDRLVVCVTTEDGDPIEVQPRYGGLGVHELAAAIEEARARGCVSGATSLQLRRSTRDDHG